MTAERSAGRIQGLAIAIHGALETPPAVLDSADVVLPSPHDAARVLSLVGRELERRLRPTKAAIAAAVPVEVVTPATPAAATDAVPPLVDDRRVEPPPV